MNFILFRNIAILIFAFLACFAWGQEPGQPVQPLPPPGYPYAYPPAPVMPFEDRLNSWINAAGVILTAIIAALSHIMAQVKATRERMDRQSVKTGLIQGEIVTLAKALPPPVAVAAAPVPQESPQEAPRGAGEPTQGTGAGGTAVVALACFFLTGCAGMKVKGQIAYFDANGNEYTYTSDGTKRMLHVQDTQGNRLGLGSDGKSMLVDVSHRAVPLPLPSRTGFAK